MARSLASTDPYPLTLRQRVLRLQETAREEVAHYADRWYLLTITTTAVLAVFAAYAYFEPVPRIWFTGIAVLAAFNVLEYLLAFLLLLQRFYIDAYVKRYFRTEP